MYKQFFIERGERKRREKVTDSIQGLFLKGSRDIVLYNESVTKPHLTISIVSLTPYETINSVQGVLVRCFYTIYWVSERKKTPPCSNFKSPWYFLKQTCSIGTHTKADRRTAPVAQGQGSQLLFRASWDQISARVVLLFRLQSWLDILVGLSNLDIILYYYVPLRVASHGIDALRKRS